MQITNETFTKDENNNKIPKSYLSVTDLSLLSTNVVGLNMMLRNEWPETFDDASALRWHKDCRFSSCSPLQEKMSLDHEQ